jgi:RNA polymerase-binding protein DksA
MASSRKSSARAGKAARPARKAASRPKSAKAKKSSSRPKARPAAKAKAAKVAPKKMLKPAAKAAKGAVQAPPGKRVIGRPAVKGKLPLKDRVIKGVARVMPPPVVRPIGVLPPESRVKTSDRPPAAFKPRPVVAPHKAKPTPAQLIPQGAQRVTEKDMKEFEERLQTERRKIEKEMGHLESTVLKVNPRDSAGDLSGYSFHMADAGTDAMEREKAFLFASTEGRLLMEITEALRRLYRGEYGMCESCGNPIARARLEAMPHARLCISCKEKEERAGRSAQ